VALKDYIWLIGAIIYVGGMFPIFYSYHFNGDTGYGLVDILATVGAFIVMGQVFTSFWSDSSKTTKPKK
jgi:hypothetical protein